MLVLRFDEVDMRSINYRESNFHVEFSIVIYKKSHRNKLLFWEENLELLELKQKKIVLTKSLIFASFMTTQNISAIS